MAFRVRYQCKTVYIYFQIKIDMFFNTLTPEPWPWQFRQCSLWTVWSPLDLGLNMWPPRWRGCCWTVWPFDLCQSSTLSGSPPDKHWSPAVKIKNNKIVNLNLSNHHFTNINKWDLYLSVVECLCQGAERNNCALIDYSTPTLLCYCKGAL